LSAGRLAGKVCLVTGTGGSIGRATALTFAREGAAVVGCDIGIEAAEQTVALVRGAGGSMVSLQPCLLDDPAAATRST
jgi:NAD(P)-dependent dehydrogenase (short-subunit alcohol dehydrogenase family)